MIKRPHYKIKHKMLRYDLIVAVCENFGIGFKGELPWSLKLVHGPHYYTIVFNSAFSQLVGRS